MAAPALRGLQKVLSQLHDDLAGPCDENLYTLRYLTQASREAPPEAAATTAQQPTRIRVLHSCSS